MEQANKTVTSKCVLFDPATNRPSTYPIMFQDIWDMYIKQRKNFWEPEELDFSKDRLHWIKLSADEQYFIKNILAFFAGSDGIVNMNLNLNFINEIQTTEAQTTYRFQSMMEDIHAETYSIMIDTYINDPAEKHKLFNAIETIPCIKKKADWALKWINDTSTPYQMRLIAFAIVEGIFFQGSFCAIYWLREKGIMPGLVQANEAISRDENAHTMFAALMYSYFPDDERISQSVIHEMFKEALLIEKEFITESLPCRLIGMNSDLMCQYLELVTDNLLTTLGYKKIFGVSCPFPFMDKLNLDGKTNFFEGRSTEYRKAQGGVKATILDTSNTLDTNSTTLVEDF